MPRKDGRFTPQERAFIPVAAATGDRTYAADKAGLKNPVALGHQLMQRPAVAAEVARLAQERLFNDVLPLAIETHIKLLTDNTVPAGAKAQAVKLAYDRTLGLQDPSGRKEIHEMTAAELAAEIEKLKARKADLARPVVDVAPDGGGALD